MSKQIVISGNRVLAHGEDCFAVTGNTVVCTNSDKVYDNATIATVEEIPADIDTVGYEYHAGLFVPCAPFGVGLGNIAVVCGNDCKAIKDSGIDINKISSVIYTTYEGTSMSNSAGSVAVYFDTDKTIIGVIVMGASGAAFAQNGDGVIITAANSTLLEKVHSFQPSISGNYFGFSAGTSNTAPGSMNKYGSTYTAIALLA